MADVRETRVTWLVEPLRVGAVQKFSGTLNHKSKAPTTRLAATVNTFVHFVYQFFLFFKNPFNLPLAACGMLGILLHLIQMRKPMLRQTVATRRVAWSPGSKLNGLGHKVFGGIGLLKGQPGWTGTVGLVRRGGVQWVWCGKAGAAWCGVGGCGEEG
ncbi:hypothetical protein B0H14DRAFT_2613186 [Mycena olivaceomarginata]|nr:hypothetical protein B0H14DRAFT_2613186 [Mycena olivaceomarginata]